jgi:hypothetical protein
MTKLPEINKLYRGKYSTDVVIRVLNVEAEKDAVLAEIVECATGSIGNTLIYFLSTFDSYYTKEEKQDELEETRVIFKLIPSNYPDHPEWNKVEVIAFLLDVPANAGNVMSYMHVGQHGEASIEFFRDCKLATDEQFADLRKELEEVGYRLYIRSRWNRG